MNCIIVDDEPHAIDVLRLHLEKIPDVELLDTFRNPIKAAIYLNDKYVDLVFLDMNMPDLTGKELLSSLTRKPMVIFTTAYSEYAVDSYEYNAIDYLVKPILFERFLKAVNKAKEQHRFRNQTVQPVVAIAEPRENIVMLKSGTQLHRVPLDDILFAEKDSNYVEVHTPDRKILIRGNFSDLIALLPSQFLFQIHKSFVIAPHHIELIETHQVTIRGNKIPIGVTYRDDFLRLVNKM